MISIVDTLPYDKIIRNKWSPDVVVGFVLKYELFDLTIIPCTTKLYNWVATGIIRTKNLDLLEKISRKQKVSSQKKRPNKHILGNSIDNRSKEIDSFKTFGHWEIDTVIGNKVKTDTYSSLRLNARHALKLL